mmetsp:Transcript_20280/g.22604  ORF Transcript_20280/g.22604 Transcript_20280/m.22604 type:complete len:95 (-) Transcript_20280:357-641(-)
MGRLRINASWSNTNPSPPNITANGQKEAPAAFALLCVSPIVVTAIEPTNWVVPKARKRFRLKNVPSLVWVKIVVNFTIAKVIKAQPDTFDKACC